VGRGWVGRGGMRRQELRRAAAAITAAMPALRCSRSVGENAREALRGVGSHLFLVMWAAPCARQTRSEQRLQQAIGEERQRADGHQRELRAALDSARALESARAASAGPFGGTRSGAAMPAAEALQRVSVCEWVRKGSRGCGGWCVGRVLVRVRVPVWGVGCGVWGVGCGVWSVECGVWGVGCGVWGMGCGVCGVWWL
jgi:hypothetical protein